MANGVFNKGRLLNNYSHAFIDKKNEPILITMLDEKKNDQLHSMYLYKMQKNVFNGLPPINDSVCKKWVNGMINSGGTQIVALSFENGVVGHAALFPMSENKVEMLIVVADKFQYRGIGTQLTRCIVQLAYEAGFENIWLSVDAHNFVAQHIYLKCGFKFLSMSQIDEVDMAFDLLRYRSMANVKIKEIINCNVVCVNKNEFCSIAIDLFLRNPIGALPVVDDENRLVGILSESDLIMEINFHQRVSTIMTREVITIKDDYTVAEVIRLCQSRKYRCFPVIDKDERFIGVIGRKDILEYYCRNL